MGDETGTPPLARRVPGASRPGPVASERPELPADLLQRMQAVVEAARAQAAAEAEAQHAGREEDTEEDTSPLPRLTASGAIAGPPVNNGAAKQDDPATKADSTAVRFGESGHPPAVRPALRRDRRARRNRERAKRERTAQPDRKGAERERTERLAAERERREQQRAEQKQAERERAERERVAEQERQQVAELERQRQLKQEEQQRKRAAEIERQRAAERERARQIALQRAEQDREQAERLRSAERDKRGLRAPDVWSPGEVLDQPQPHSRKVLRGRLYAVAAAVAAVAGLLTGVLLSKASSPHHAGAPHVASSPRDQAAAWVAQQVSPEFIVSCDPVMCRALKAAGVPSAHVMVLNSTASTPFPLNSQVIVATAVVRNAFGGRLSSVYAPAVIASFGTGSSRIDVRAVARDGPAAYWSAYNADFQQRKQDGAALSAVPTIVESSLARHQLTAGLVDARLLFDIGFLVNLKDHFEIVSFGDSAPGATAGMPLRSATLEGAAAELRSMLASLGTPTSPYYPQHAHQTGTAGQSALVIEFGAPSPLGTLTS